MFDNILLTLGAFPKYLKQTPRYKNLNKVSQKDLDYSSTSVDEYFEINVTERCHRITRFITNA